MSDDSWQETWNARQSTLESILGPADDKVLHAIVPFVFSGQADVLSFRKHIPGRVYATCDLLGEPAQKRNSLGTYELVIAHRDENSWGAKVVSRLARHTCDIPLKGGRTMNIGRIVPPGSSISALLFCKYRTMTFQGSDAGLLLCIGITADELAACRNGKRQEVYDALTAGGVFPYTDLFRSSVL